MEIAADDIRRIAQLDASFHKILGQAAKNRVLRLANEPAELFLIPTTTFILSRVKEGRSRLMEAHRQIIDAVRRRDRDRAREATRRHMEDWRKGFLRTGNDLEQPIDWPDLEQG